MIQQLVTNSRPQTCSCSTDQKVICLNYHVSHVFPHLSNCNLKCQHVGKATAGAYSYPCTLMQCNPCQAPQNKAPGCPLAAAAPLTLPLDRPGGITVRPPWYGWGPSALPKGRGRLCSCCASAAGMSVPVAVSASSLSVPLHHPLAVQSRSPNGCSGLVHACSTWSLCCPIAKLVLLSRNTAVRGTPGLPDTLSFLGKGRKQILPVGKS